MVKLTILPQQQAPKQITAFRRVSTLGEHKVAFLNANNQGGFPVEEITPKKKKRVITNYIAVYGTPTQTTIHSARIVVRYELEGPPRDNSTRTPYITGMGLFRKHIVSTRSMFSYLPLDDSEYHARREQFLLN